MNHQVGTCRMASSDAPSAEEHAVVDSQLRVMGVKGLRVADASIIPHMQGSNIHATVMLVGEKAADLLTREYRRLSVRRVRQRGFLNGS